MLSFLGSAAGQLQLQSLGSLVTSSSLSIVMLCSVLFVTTVWYLKNLKRHKIIDLIPGPKGLPLIGNSLDFMLGPHELFHAVISMCDYGNVVRVWIGFKAYVYVHRPSTAEEVLSSMKHITKANDYTYLQHWLGTGLLTSTGKKWKSRRKMLTPAFHFKILEDFVDVFNSQSLTLTEKIEKHSDGDTFDIYPYITLCTLDIILETAMGRTIHAQDNEESDYVKAIYKLSALFQQRTSRPWLKSELLWWLFGYKAVDDANLKVLHDFAYSTIRERRLQSKESKEKKEEKPAEEDIFGRKKRKAFLDLMLEFSDAGGNLSDEDIREEVDTFMFEGHDTTAAGINWAVYLLGSNPTVQAKLHEELDAIFGDSDRPVTSADLREMKYTENCLKEALRIFPSVPIIGRELMEDAVIDGYKVPSGTTLMVLPYRIHRDPEQFPNPEEFNPDNFLAENCLKRHPYAYVPFSAGPRNCIGQKFALMEEKIVLSSMMRKYRIESMIPRNDLKLISELILKPLNGTLIKLHSRQSITD